MKAMMKKTQNSSITFVLALTLALTSNVIETSLRHGGGCLILAYLTQMF